MFIQQLIIQESVKLSVSKNSSSFKKLNSFQLIRLNIKEKYYKICPKIMLENAHKMNNKHLK